MKCLFFLHFSTGKHDRIKTIFNISASLLFTVAAISLIGGYFIMKMWIDPDSDYLFMLYIFMGVFVLIIVSSQLMEAVLWVRFSI